MRKSITPKHPVPPLGAPIGAYVKGKGRAKQEEPATRPPGARGQGRKALQEGAESIVVPIRMTATQKQKLQELGGAAWIRDRIEKARA